MELQVEDAVPFSRGVDTVLTLGVGERKALWARGVGFVIRYLRGKYTVTANELEALVMSGFAVMLVTPSRLPGWDPVEALKDEEGKEDVERLWQLGIPPGCTVWLDLEGCDGPPRVTAQWCNAWAKEIVNAGYQAGLYVGADPGGLDSWALWKLPQFTRYWRSGSQVPEPSNRGWCMQQLRPLNTSLGGVKVDVNVIEKDYRGGLPRWVVWR